MNSGHTSAEVTYRTSVRDALGNPVPDEGSLRVWLDDDLMERQAPAGWVHLRTVREVCFLILTERVVELSLDNDLNGDVEFGLGYEVVDFLDHQQGAFGKSLWPEDGMTVHSANSSGRDRMVRALDSISDRYGIEVESTLTPGGKPKFLFPSKS